MSKKMRWIFLCTYILFILILGLLRNWPDGKVHIVFCNVGQGDAIYIRFPNQSDMLIDSGPDSRVLGCLSDHMPFFDRTVDVAMLTHPQKDHFGGFLEIFRRYQVGRLITVPVTNEEDSFKQLVKLLVTKKIPITYATSGDVIKFGETEINIIWPQKQWMENDLSQMNEISLVKNFKNQHLPMSLKTNKDLNFYSLYAHLRFGKFDALFTGDGDQSTQLAITQAGLITQIPQNIELLKVPHHGSKTGLLDSFLKYIKPQMAVIQVRKNNTYGHPSIETIKRLEVSAKVFTTEKGSIEIITDGERVGILP